MQRAVRGATGERVSDRVHQEQVRRAREQEASAASRSVLVDQRLDGEEEVGLPLDLVERQRRVPLKQVVGRLGGLLTHPEVVQREVRTVRERLAFLGQRALARLASSGEHDHGERLEVGVQGGVDQSGTVGGHGVARIHPARG